MCELQTTDIQDICRSIENWDDLTSPMCGKPVEVVLIDCVGSQSMFCSVHGERMKSGRHEFLKNYDPRRE